MAIPEGLPLAVTMALAYSMKVGHPVVGLAGRSEDHLGSFFPCSRLSFAWGPVSFAFWGYKEWAEGQEGDVL